MFLLYTIIKPNKKNNKKYEKNTSCDQWFRENRAGVL